MAKPLHELTGEVAKEVGILLAVFAPLDTLFRTEKGTSLDWLVSSGLCFLVYLPWVIFFVGMIGTVLLGYRSIERKRREKETTLHQTIDRLAHLLEEVENSSSVSDETREKIKNALHARP